MPVHVVSGAGVPTERRQLPVASVFQKERRHTGTRQPTVSAARWLHRLPFRVLVQYHDRPQGQPQAPLSCCPEHLNCSSLSTFSVPSTELWGSQGTYFPIISASDEGHSRNSLATPPGRWDR